ncbi:MAG: DUF2254 domain-containing protein [Deltaproteobacteria bacterium]|nr:DUF2254 domain-containing protein [Deltaproteobacteria bacterium]
MTIAEKKPQRAISKTGSTGHKSVAWLRPILLLGGITALWFVGLLLLQQLLDNGVSVLSSIGEYHSDDAQSALGNLPEVVVAVLGIAITVVSIIVQLSATRYTPRVTEMFFGDRSNLIVLGFFVVTSIHCIWATFVVHSGFLPQVLIAATVLIMTVAILVLIPYFAYVFAFVEPQRIVSRLQAQALDDALAATGSEDQQPRQRHVLASIEQLADVAINSISNKDRIIASRSVDALRDLARGYLIDKRRLSPSWFVVGGALKENPDFTVMAERSVEELSSGSAWLEFKILRQYQMVFHDCLNRMRDVSQLVAINTRYIGQDAVELGDTAVAELTIKFFNTYMRYAINARDVRTAYNVLHQYRQLAEALLRATHVEQVRDIGQYLKYYGQTANAAGLPFVTETAAYDFCALCELAHQLDSPAHDGLLATFLEVDKAPETEAEERSLRGVRKAQIKLATYYLAAGDESRARQIQADMAQEGAERLRSIRQELASVVDRDFWEIIDRGDNLEYLPQHRRAQLAVFFSWFGAHVNTD